MKFMSLSVRLHILAGVLLAAGLALPQIARADDSGVQGKTVCFVTAAAAHPYVTPANGAVESIAKEAGITLIELSQEFDVQTGTGQLNTCIGRGADGIILWPLDPAAYTAGLQKATSAGIPVVVMNSPVDDAAAKLIKSFTGPDPYQTGVLGADLLTEALGKTGNIVVISGQAGNGTSISTEQGFKDELAKLGSQVKILQTVYANFDQQASLVASRDLITRFGDQIDAAYTIDDGMAHGFIDAWKEHGSAKVPMVTGVNGQKDAFELIKEGRLYGTVLQSPVEDGTAAIKTMISVLKGETVPVRVPIPLPVITAKNIDQHQPSF
jgi:ABC-type sugar transport system substrate-binding protein